MVLKSRKVPRYYDPHWRSIYKLRNSYRKIKFHGKTLGKLTCDNIMTSMR